MTVDVEDVLLYLGSALLAVWGVAHSFPTRDIVQDFGEDVSKDNQRIIAMEWINEGATLIFLGALTAAVTAVHNEESDKYDNENDHANDVAFTAYICVVIMLNVMSIISLSTGFKIKFLPFKLCPIIFTGSSGLILAGALLSR